MGAANIWLGLDHHLKCNAYGLNETRRKSWQLIRMNKKRRNEKKIRSRSVVVAIAAVVCLIVIAVLVRSDSLQHTQYPQAYKFSLIDLEGKEFTLADYEGKVVVLDFMGPSCVPCREQVVELGKVYDAYSGRVEIISICVYTGEGMREELQSFADSYNAEWKFAVDDIGTAVDYQIQRIPTTVIVDQDGYIRFTHVGLTSADTITSEVETLLKGA